MRGLIVSGLIIFFFVAQALAKNCVFFGIVPGGAPSIENSLEKEMRKNLFQSDVVKLVNREKTEIIEHQGGFLESREMLGALKGKIQRAAGTNSIAVWARVKSFRIKPERRNLIRAVASGDLVVEFVIFDIQSDTRVFTGELRAHKEDKVDFIFFRNVNKVVHIGVDNRTRITDSLIKDISGRFFNVTESVAQGNMNSVSEKEVVEEVDVSGVDEIFNIPGMEGREIEE